MTHTLMVHPSSGQVCYLSQPYPGRRHDKRICDEAGYPFPDLSQRFQDTGFQGDAPAEGLVYQPQKKPRGADLPVADAVINAAISTARITVAHVIGGVKRPRILKDTFRHHLQGFDDTGLAIACGLHHLRTPHRHPVDDFDLLAFLS